MDELTQVCVQRVARMDGGSVGVMSACGAREKKTGELLSGYGISNGIVTA